MVQGILGRTLCAVLEPGTTVYDTRVARTETQRDQQVDLSRLVAWATRKLTHLTRNRLVYDDQKEAEGDHEINETEGVVEGLETERGSGQTAGEEEGCGEDWAAIEASESAAPQVAIGADTKVGCLERSIEVNMRHLPHIWHLPT